jgi:hypothetical protein
MLPQQILKRAQDERLKASHQRAAEIQKRPRS